MSLFPVQPVPSPEPPLDAYRPGAHVVHRGRYGRQFRRPIIECFGLQRGAVFPMVESWLSAGLGPTTRPLGSGDVDDAEPASFTGVTAEGSTLRSDGHVHSTNYLPRMERAGSYGAFQLSQLECSRAATGPVTQHRFGLVNFALEGTVRVPIDRSGGTHSIRGLPVALPVGDRIVNGFLVAAEEATHRYRRVITHKSAEVLAELVVPKTDGIEGADLVGAVSDLSVVLSVMRGTRVVWIYRNDYSEKQIVHTTHRSNIVKAYSPWAPIRGSYEHREASAAFIRTGLEALSTSPVLIADRCVVDAYPRREGRARLSPNPSRKTGAGHRKAQAHLPTLWGDRAW